MHDVLSFAIMRAFIIHFFFFLMISSSAYACTCEILFEGSEEGRNRSQKNISESNWIINGKVIDAGKNAALVEILDVYKGSQKDKFLRVGYDGLQGTTCTTSLKLGETKIMFVSKAPLFSGKDGIIRDYCDSILTKEDRISLGLQKASNSP